jgi:hypothetical protein
MAAEAGCSLPAKPFDTSESGGERKVNDMELDRALELAVVACWEDVVKPGDTCSVHVEYEKHPDSPLSSLAVWTIRNRGYGTLVCCYSVAASNCASPSFEVPSIHFANSCHSKKLADTLDFVIKNQNRFTRPADRSIHGVVQIDCPSEDQRSEGATWSQAVRTEFAETVLN